MKDSLSQKKKHWSFCPNILALYSLIGWALLEAYLNFHHHLSICIFPLPAAA